MTSITGPFDSFLRDYCAAVQEAPAYLHLTSEQDRPLFFDRHVMDAVSLHSILPIELKENKIRVADVGTGNGIPGVPIAILQPSWDVFLIDSDTKKASFLDMFIKNKHLKNTTVLTERSEIIAKQEIYRESFDLVFARALAKLPSALEYTSPLLKQDGTLVILLAGSIQEQLDSAQNALNDLCLRIDKRIPYFKDHPFEALFIKKTAPTPARFPRKLGLATKRPL